MALNPLALLKLKDRLTIFKTEHPKVLPFFRAVNEKGLEPGAVIEMKVIMAGGQEYTTNIRVTPDDVETIDMLSSLSRHRENA